MPGGPALVAAGELARKAVANELAAADAPGHYMYRLTKETPRGAEATDMIETRDWLLGRLVSTNGQPLTPVERRKEDGRLRRLLTDNGRLEELQKNEHHDEERVRRMMKALPDAFLYEYDGTEKSDCCATLVRLKFRPNPSFDPPSRELRVL